MKRQRNERSKSTRVIGTSAIKAARYLVTNEGYLRTLKVNTRLFNERKAHFFESDSPLKFLKYSLGANYKTVGDEGHYSIEGLEDDVVIYTTTKRRHGRVMESLIIEVPIAFDVLPSGELITRNTEETILVEDINSPDMNKEQITKIINVYLDAIETDVRTIQDDAQMAHFDDDSLDEDELDNRSYKILDHGEIVSSI